MSSPRHLHIPSDLWTTVVAELRSRGRLTRESGAFLLGHRGSAHDTVVRAAYYDDIDPSSLRGRYILFDQRRFGELWATCRASRCDVIADVHTHPHDWVGQSATDQAHPMIDQIGHVALILPHYAREDPSVAGIGVHEYVGSGRWRSFIDGAQTQRIRIT